MLDLFYVFIFGKFYFYESSFLVNHTDCLNICIEREMKLPNANDNQFILRQLASQFGSRFEKEIKVTANETSDRSNLNKNFLAYFIGELKSLRFIGIDYLI